jgi:hypothetical protein
MISMIVKTNDKENSRDQPTEKVASEKPTNQKDKNFGGAMNKTLILSFLIVSLFFVTAAPAQKDRSGNLKSSISKVTLFGTTTVVPAAGSTLSRNNEGVYWNISTSGLPVGEVVTLWVAVFNDPSYCAPAGCSAPDLNNPFVNGSLQYAGGAIVGVNGRADFSGYLAAGDNTGAAFPFPGLPNPAPGIVNPKAADIHLVIRKHGPANSDPTILQQQLSSFGGGCNLGGCANIQASVHQP